MIHYLFYGYISYSDKSTVENETKKGPYLFAWLKFLYSLPHILVFVAQRLTSSSAT